VVQARVKFDRRTRRRSSLPRAARSAAWLSEPTCHTTRRILSLSTSTSLIAGPSPSFQWPGSSGLTGASSRCHRSASAATSCAPTTISRVPVRPSGPPLRLTSSAAVAARALATSNEWNAQRKENGRVDAICAINAPGNRWRGREARGLIQKLEGSKHRAVIARRENTERTTRGVEGEDDREEAAGTRRTTAPAPSKRGAGTKELTNALTLTPASELEDGPVHRFRPRTWTPAGDHGHFGSVP